MISRTGRSCRRTRRRERWRSGASAAFRRIRSQSTGRSHEQEICQALQISGREGEEPTSSRNSSPYEAYSLTFSLPVETPASFHVASRNRCADSFDLEPMATTSCRTSETWRVLGSTSKSRVNLLAIQPVLKMPQRQVCGDVIFSSSEVEAEVGEVKVWL